MTRRILLSLGVFFLSVAMLMAAVVRGQDEKKPAENPKVAELGSIKQAEAREKLQALEETMDRLARLLGATEPDKALKLREAFATSRKRLLREGMDRVVRFIEERKLYEARETQDSLVQNLQDLLDILLEKDIDPRELIKAVRELRDIVKDLDQIIQEETSEKIASDDAEAAKDALSALKGQKERLEDLIEAEKAIEKSVAAQQGSSSKGADSKDSKVSEEQKSELER